MLDLELLEQVAEFVLPCQQGRSLGEVVRIERCQFVENGAHLHPDGVFVHVFVLLLRASPMSGWFVKVRSESAAVPGRRSAVCGP